MVGITVFNFSILMTSSLQAWAQGDVKDCDQFKEDEEKYAQCLSEIKKILESKISETRSQAQTLTNAINFTNNQIQLQKVQIYQTQTEISLLEKELANLNERIDGLVLSLDRLTEMLIVRVQASYKQTRTNPVIALFTNSSFSDFINQYKYLQQAERQIARAMQEAENQRLLYDEQKNLKEIKQAQLEEKRSQLDTQRLELERSRQAKQKLLEDTRNDERTYQALLQKAKAELEAIEAIAAGKGIEEKIKDVKQGEKIATVISGASCNSSGTHLHFVVKKNNINQNPFSYLQTVEHENVSNDPFNPSGSWAWPLKPPIRLTQGYGYTWAINNTWVGRIYRFHNGIDIVSKNSVDILSVHDGALYRGRYDAGCSLKYVKVVNEEEKLETLYLHVNYF
jgi:peptidoglycan hydrolase CwlO-like protein